VAKKNKDDDRKVVAENRKARFAYAIESAFEAGIQLMGRRRSQGRRRKSQGPLRLRHRVRV